MLSNSSPISWRIIIAFAAVYIIWGSTYLFMFFTLQTLPAFIMAAIRFIIVGGTLYLYTILVAKEKIDSELWKFGIITGFFLFFIGNGTVVLAQKNLPSGLVSILAGTVPFWILIFDTRSGKARFKNLFTWLGLLIGFGGLFILFADKINVNQNNPTLTLSYFFMLVGALAWTFGTLYSKNTKIAASTNAKMSVQTLTAGIMFLIATLLHGDWIGFSFSQVSLLSWSALFYLIVFGSIIGFYCFLWLLTKVSAHAVTTHSFVNPLVAVFLGTLFAGERFEPKEYLSLVCILAGLVFIYLGRKKA